ncbi:MAG: DUF1810 domain-containing protein [Rhodobacteraceae bacterium]|nr:MAG: DUF1810 domain-containing protein [Paracoccaceae bacterium]
MTLSRFVEAQAPVWATALAELQAGCKQSHWMWFVFPQLAVLGRSQMARRYGIADLAEARAYAAHDLLGPRLRQAAAALLDHPGRTAEEIMGGVDAMKLRSSMTLFERADPGCDTYGRVLETFHEGRRCAPTLDEIGTG